MGKPPPSPQDPPTPNLFKLVHFGRRVVVLRLKGLLVMFVTNLYCNFLGTLSRCPNLGGRLQYICTVQCNSSDMCSGAQVCCQHDCGTVCVNHRNIPVREYTLTLQSSQCSASGVQMSDIRRPVFISRACLLKAKQSDLSSHYSVCMLA